MNIPHSTFLMESSAEYSSELSKLFILDEPLKSIERANEVTPINELLIEILHAARRHLDLQVAFIAEFAETRRIFRYVDSDPNLKIISVGDDGPIEDSYCLRVADGRLPQLMQDAAKVPAALELPVTVSLPIGAHISIPLVLGDGSLYGTFCAFSTVADPTLNERDLILMRLFASLAAKQLDKIQSLNKKAIESRKRIRSVLESKNFELHYQPIFKVSLGKFIGVEALARFRDTPLRPPNLWFDEAESAGLLADLEAAVIEKASNDLLRLPADSYMSLNISPKSLLIPRCFNIIKELPAKKIVIEITEHALVDDYPLFIEAIGELRNLGMRFAVDDAGAGYSCFRHILLLKPDICKLDISLIRNIDTSLECRALAAALIRFGEETGCRMIAEGVETEAELETLTRLNVDKVQGYLLGRPMRFDEALKFLGEGRIRS